MSVNPHNLKDPVKAIVEQKERAVTSLVALIAGLLLVYVLSNKYAEKHYAEQIQLQASEIRLIEEIKFSFKVQVQEWKNTLLRGSNKQDFLKYYSAFSNEQEKIQKLSLRLAALTQEQSQISRHTLDFMQEHSFLYDQYNSALKGFDSDSKESVFAVDSRVRGIDRPLTVALNELEVLINNDVAVRANQLAKYKQWFEIGLSVILVMTMSLLLMRLFQLAKRSVKSMYSHRVTGVYNKDALYLSFQHLIELKRPLSLLLADIDNFKTINEVKGVAEADRLLNDLVAFLSQNEQIRFYHISSNMFVFIPINQSLPPEELEKNMQSRFDYFKSQWATDKFDLSFTTCVCTLDIQDATADEIFNRCSAAMQEAKACGKGLHHHYEELRERIDKRQQVMRSALTIDDLVAQDKLTLYGQAIVANEKEQTLPRYEILLRVLENGQHHSPFMILEAAEKYDKSVLIDRFVVNQVFEFLKASQAPFVCSINISAQSLNHQSFIDYLVQKVTDNQHLSGLLIFELTETTILGNLDVAKNLFEQLHSLGCRIAIDDFGVGESSLRYLMELSVDIVKIDGFFIKQLKSSTKARSLVEAMVSICDALDIETVGEFVEDEKTQRLITDIGVTYSQGYGVHIPEALSDAIQKRHL